MAEPPVRDRPPGGQGQSANEGPLRALVDEALRVVEAEGDEEIDARLGAIQYVLDSGSFDHPSLYRLMPIDGIRIAFPGLPPFPDLIGIGRRLRRKILEFLHEILCSGKDIWDLARKIIERAIDRGAELLAEAVAAVLVGSGIVATIAGLVAGGIVAFLVARGVRLSCEKLEEYLRVLAG